MIPYRHRFHGYNALRYVSKHGQAVRSQYVTLKCSSNPKRPLCRIAVVVSKKVSKSAVSRNRIRRRIYEELRRRLPEIQSHHDIVVYVSHAALKDMPAQTLSGMIGDVLTQAGLCQNEVKSGIVMDKKVGS